MRKEIKEFAEDMETIMLVNDQKKGDTWKDPKICSIDWLQYKLREEIFEFEEFMMKCPKTHKTGKLRELVDIANVCMMLHYRLDKQLGDIL